MKRIEITGEEVYSSREYQELCLVVPEGVARYYAELELVAKKELDVLPTAVEPLPFNEWYRQYLASPEWKEKADAAKARFGERCALCSSTDNLEAHHRTYERVGHEDIEDLTALCSSCHRAYHDWRTGALRRR